MALTQVRVKLENTWTVLTYNSATGRYEAELTAPGTSIHQPGGYYSLTAEATNATGQTTQISGAQLQGLRLVVRETTAPDLTLTSPPAGYVTTDSPKIVFRASDEPGGSGIDTASGQAAIDGVPVPCTVAAAGTAYSLTIQAQGLSEGPHTVTASIADRDGNRTTASAAYIVDTVPPVLLLTVDDLHRVVDVASLEVSGYAADATAGIASVTVAGAPAQLGEDGRFSVIVPLAVGENHIAAVVTDNAGLTSSQTLYRIRLITDRTRADRDALDVLLAKPMEQWTAAELSWFNAGVLRGGYCADDLNRVGLAVELIAGWMHQAGYLAPVSPKINWTALDAPVQSQMGTYLSNVETVRDTFPLEGAPEVPPDMDDLELQEANDIETILVRADETLTMLSKSFWVCGEPVCGGY